MVEDKTVHCQQKNLFLWYNTELRRFCTFFVWQKQKNAILIKLPKFINKRDVDPVNFRRCVHLDPSRRRQKLKPSYYLCYLYTHQRRSIVFVLHNPRRFISIRSAVETRVVFTQSLRFASYIPHNGTEWLLKTKVCTVLLCLKPVVFSFGYINMLNLLYKFHDIYFYFK